MSVDPARLPVPPLSGEDNRTRELRETWGVCGAAIAFTWSAFVLLDQLTRSAAKPLIPPEAK